MSEKENICEAPPNDGALETSSEKWKRVVWDIGREKIVIERKYSTLYISRIVYPVYPYGNYVEHYFWLDLEKKEMGRGILRNSWGGTGNEPHGHFSLTDEELQEVLEIIKKIQGPDDLETLDDFFSKVYEAREEKIREIWEQLEYSLDDLIAKDEELQRLISTKNAPLSQIRERFIEFLVEYDP